MARYTGPITKKSRRLKTDLVGGDKNFDLRPFPPGQHGRRRIQEKEYLTQLQEKQKARFTYGVMEKQFRRYYKEAANRPGKTGENLLTILESRLDNVIYRAGLARTRRQARQLVTHGHFVEQGEGHGLAHTAQVHLAGLAGGVQGDHTSGQGEAHGGGVKR